ncbi:2-C-methyl-D-erythritol 4-phosphate cytidylyltransferase [bacterium HR33]|nr:2-C-methyl-D-erythritol 4-phosphate cytidylyltransferase [bacterium HR33]
MLLRALRPFAQHPRVAQIVVALPPAVAGSPPEWLASLAGGRLHLVAGGATRSRSVAAALSALDGSCRIVLVHDAARPFVSAETIDRVIAAAEKGVGAVAAVPVYDTIKRSSENGRIVETVDRRSLWRAQTPQGFPREMLEAAYRKLKAPNGESDPSDDAQAVEQAGFEVVLVPDLTTNIKITTPEDFSLAEALARR